MHAFTLISILLLANLAHAETPMHQDHMETFVKQRSEVIESRPGFVLFTYNQVGMALISDVKHDRMRIIAPVERAANLTPSQKDAVLAANFHSALDARYATGNEMLYAAYIHPLSPLTTEQLRSALDQVASLVLTFGDEYSSGALTYRGR